MSPKKVRNVTKDMQDLYPESHKTLLRKSKNALNNRRIYYIHRLERVVLLKC